MPSSLRIVGSITESSKDTVSTYIKCPLLGLHTSRLYCLQLLGQLPMMVRIGALCQAPDRCIPEVIELAQNNPYGRGRRMSGGKQPVHACQCRALRTL